MCNDRRYVLAVPRRCTVLRKISGGQGKLQDVAEFGGAVACGACYFVLNFERIKRDVGTWLFGKGLDGNGKDAMSYDLFELRELLKSKERAEIHVDFL